MAGVIGAVLRQIPTFALHDPQPYAEQLAQIHAAYDPITIVGLNVGPVMVDVFDWLGFFRVFSAPWFIFLLTLLAVSIVVCTLDRTPGLWRAARHVKVVQAAPSSTCAWNTGPRFNDVDAGALDELEAVLRPRHFRLQRAEAAGARARLRRQEPVPEAGHALHPPWPDPLPGRRGADHRCSASRRSSSWARARPRQCRRSARPTTCSSRTSTSRRPTRPDGSFADFTTDLAVYREWPAGGAQDHPRQRPARGRRLRLPPEHLRPGREPDHPRSRRRSWCGRARCCSPASWPACRRAS